MSEHEFHKQYGLAAESSEWLTVVVHLVITLSTTPVLPVLRVLPHHKHNDDEHSRSQWKAVSRLHASSVLCPHHYHRSNVECSELALTWQKAASAQAGNEVSG